MAIDGANGNGCVIALDKADVTDVTDSGGTKLNLNNCSLYINSDDKYALNMSGGATINACSAFITGNYVTSGGASLTTPPAGSSCPAGSGTFTGVSPISDPYCADPCNLCVDPILLRMQPKQFQSEWRGLQNPFGWVVRLCLL